VILRNNRRWVVAFGKRNHYVRLPSLACRDELVEFGDEWIAVWRTKAWDWDVVQALAVARMFSGWGSTRDTEVGNESSVDIAADGGARGCGDACGKRE